MTLVAIGHRDRLESKSRTPSLQPPVAPHPVLHVFDWFCIGIDDPEERLRGRVLAGMLLILLGISLAGAIATVHQRGFLDPGISRALISSLKNIFLLTWLRKSADARGPAIVHCWLIYILINLAIVGSSDVGPVLLVWLFLVPTMAMFLCGQLVGTIMAVAVAVSIVYFSDVFFPSLISSGNDTREIIATVPVALATLTAITALYMRAIRSALERVENVNRELGRRESDLRLLLDNTHEGIWSVNRDLEILAANDRGLEVQNLSAVDGQAPIWLEMLQRSLDGEAVRIERCRVTGGSGESWLDISTFPLEVSGRIEGATAFVRDVSVEVVAETRERQLNAQLVEASRRAGMGETATDTLHHVGNLLNSINVGAGLLAEDLKSDRQQRWLEKLSEMTNSMRSEGGKAVPIDDEQLKLAFEKVDQLLAVERVDRLSKVDEIREQVSDIEQFLAQQNAQVAQDRSCAYRQHCELADLIDRAVEVAKAGSPCLCRIERDLAATPQLNTDADRVVRILACVIKNAFDALDEVGEACVTIGSSCTVRGRVEITIEDNGPGIAEDQLAKIFRTDASRSTYGLHGAANAASALGGRLSATSKGSGTGARFSLTLPVVTQLG